MSRSLSATSLWALWRRECFSLLVVPSTYVVLTLFAVTTSFIFYLVPLQQGLAMIDPLVQVVKFLGIFFVPLLTMRLFAEERRTGTIELLMTAPVRPAEVVLAKGAAAYLFYLVMLSPFAAYIGLLLWAGNLDRGQTAAGLLGLALLGGVYVAVGLFVSALTRSQIAAAIGGIFALFSLWLVWWLGEEGEGPAARLWRGVALKAHFDNSLGKGVLDTADVVYFLSVAGFFLFLTWLVVSAAGTLGGGAGARRPRRDLAACLLGAAAVELALLALAAYDVQGLAYESLGAVWRRGDHAALAWVFVPGAAAALAAGGVLLLYRAWTGLGLGGAALAVLMIHLGAPAGGWLRTGALLLVLALAAGGGVWLLARSLGGRAASTVLGVLAVAALLVNLNLLAGRHHWRRDLTDAGLNRLSPATRRLLERLPEPVEVTVYYTARNQYDGFPLLERTADLLQEYRAASGMVRVSYLDPARAPLAAQEEARRVGVGLERLHEFALVRYRDRRTLIPWQYVVRRQQSYVGEGPPSFHGEEVFTQGIRQVFDPRRKTVYFTAGHGEYDPFAEEEAPRRLGRLVKELRLAGYGAERLAFMEGTPIPPDCDLLVLAGPFAPFSTGELAALAGYLEGGGRLLVLLDPRQDDDPRNGLAGWLARYGVVADDNLLVDFKHSVRGDISAIQVVGSPDHPITRSQGEVVCVLLRARSLGVRAVEGWSPQRVLVTSDQARQRRAGAAEEAGFSRTPHSYPVAVSSTGPQGGRLLVVGDADLAGNYALKLGHNRPFLLSAVRWLDERDGGTAIPETVDEDRSFTLSDGQRRVVWWVAVVAVPQIFLVAGLLVWWRRRR